MYHGLLLIDKPIGVTSHDVVNRVRKAFGTREVGHAGTLDPMASGLLILLIGEATKISDYVLNEDKSYQLRVRFGVRTDTLDMTGQILTHEDVHLPIESIRSAAQSLVGSFMWPVPAYSAVKVNGQKLYQAARAQTSATVAENIELPVKEMIFWDLNVTEATSQAIEAHIYCSKGSYIRRWASELGEKLGCGGALEALRRTGCEPYRLSDALSLEAIDKVAEAIKLAQTIEGHSGVIPLRETLQGWRTVSVRGRDQMLLLNGQIPMEIDRRLLPEKKQAIQSGNPVRIKVLGGDSGEMLALLEAHPNRGLKICRIFKLVDVPQNQ